MNACAATPRFVTHGGPVSPLRSLTIPATVRGMHRLQIPAGADLFESIEAFATRSSCDTAAFRLIGGVAGELALMTGKPSSEPGQVATFHGPHVIDCPALVLGGHGAIGRGPDRRWALHAHATFVDAADRVRGCHVIRSRCVAAETGFVVAIAPLDGARFSVRHDAETGFDIFFPQASGAHLERSAP